MAVQALRGAFFALARGSAPHLSALTHASQAQETLSVHNSCDSSVMGTAPAPRRCRRYQTKKSTLNSEFALVSRRLQIERNPDRAPRVILERTDFERSGERTLGLRRQGKIPLPAPHRLSVRLRLCRGPHAAIPPPPPNDARQLQKQAGRRAYA